MGSREDVSTRCIVVAKDGDSNSVIGSVVPVKGSSHEFQSRSFNEFVRELGLEVQDLVLQSDQEGLLAEVGRAKTF